MWGSQCRKRTRGSKDKDKDKDNDVDICLLLSCVRNILIIKKILLKMMLWSKVNHTKFVKGIFEPKSYAEACAFQQVDPEDINKLFDVHIQYRKISDQERSNLSKKQI